MTLCGAHGGGKMCPDKRHTRALVAYKYVLLVAILLHQKLSHIYYRINLKELKMDFRMLQQNATVENYQSAQDRYQRILDSMDSISKYSFREKSAKNFGKWYTISD